MSDKKRREIFKKRPALFTDANARLVRGLQNEDRIRNQRAENFSRLRNIRQEPETQASQSHHPNTRLDRWRAQRAIKRKIEQRKKKPIFKVGIVHHRFYSPPTSVKAKKMSEPCHSKGALAKSKKNATPPKRITRATEKRLAAKVNLETQTPAVASQASTSKSNASVQRRLSIKKEKQKSFAPVNYSFKAPRGIDEIPMFGRIAIPQGWETEGPKVPNSPQPSTSNADNSSLQNQWSISDEILLKLAMEKPWPTQDFSNAASPQKVDKHLVRQSKRYSQESAATESTTNSSIDGSFKLRLSPEYGNSEEEQNKEESSDSNAAAPQKKGKRLVRQSAIRRYSEVSVATESTTNSSIDGSFKLRLSPEYENSEEQQNKEESSGSDLENTEGNVVEGDDVPVETPPRSGTPVPASFSPYIVSSRGKDNVRKEQQARMGIRRSVANEIPTKDTVMQNLNISIEEEEQTAQYFKHLLQRETERLNDLCTEWEKIKNTSDISEDAEYQINAAIGQTNLLLRKKFTRFQSLIKDCETGKGEMLVGCKDLAGFWELINREIKDCESRFLKLKILQSNDWVESETVVAKVIKKRATVVPTKPKINAKSSARSWILAARKKKMLQNFDRDVIAGQSTVEDDLSPSSVTTEAKFDSPKKTITPKKTPTSLLKRVQLSQASKNIRSPLTVIKISKMCKTPEVTLDDTISYVNSDQTPAKGILKKSESTSEPKSSRKVDFNNEIVAEEFPAAEVDEALQNSIDLGRALARIDSYDSDDSTSEKTDNVTFRKVRLDFEDDIFDEVGPVDTFMESTEVMPNINVIPPTPVTKLTSKNSSITEEASFEEEQVRPMVLRNRTITLRTPTRNTRRSSRVSRADELSTSMTHIKENCNPQRETNAGSNISETSKDFATDYENVNLSHRRRSTRKSVRFNPDDDCKACGETPKHKRPMTPRSRERRRISLLGDNRRESVTPLPGGDLMMFDTPKHTPRMRRSSCK